MQSELKRLIEQIENLPEVAEVKVTLWEDIEEIFKGINNE